MSHSNLTNKYNLPEQVVRMLSREHYDGSSADYSVTQLIDSPRRVHLHKRHNHEVREDALDRYWSFLGNMAHQIMEAASEGVSNANAEERYFHSVLDRVISGKIDCHTDGVIQDYKYTSVWSIINQSSVRSWEKQLNLYAYLLRRNNRPVHRLEVVVLLRDWMESKVGDRGYPTTPIMIVPIPLWNINDQEEYVWAQVQILKDSEPLEDNDLPECTAEDRWEKPSTWAVMRKNRKTALRVLSSEEEARVWMEMQSTLGTYIQERPGECTRCLRYCRVNQWCSQFKGGGKHEG